MQGGVLIVTRSIKRHSYFLDMFYSVGFRNVEITAVDKDGLNMIIYEKRPQIIIIEADFYLFATPLMVKDLIKNCGKKVRIVVFTVAKLPPDLGLWFIVNGVKSFLDWQEGDKEFFHGLECVIEGKDYISPDVAERMSIRDELMKPATHITECEFAVLHFMLSGIDGIEIADNMRCSIRTVNAHKSSLYNKLGVSGEGEVFKLFENLKTFNCENLVYYGRKFALRPLPKDDKQKYKNKKTKQAEAG